MVREYMWGFDVGIGSVGWAVISSEGSSARIEDCGVRVFESGELQREKKRQSQVRRQNRGIRRLVRRRRHRKERLKAYLSDIKLLSEEQVQAWYEQNNPNIYLLRVKALEQRLFPEELAAVLIHICNHRGYRDFYECEEEVDLLREEDSSSLIEEMGDEERNAYESVAAFDRLFDRSIYRTVADVYARHPVFNDACMNTRYPFVRNRETRRETYIPNRRDVKAEAEQILEEQSKYYACLTKDVQERIIEGIIFAQRDFETGPGIGKDGTRVYAGFLDNIGMCMYYQDERRGFRGTVLADLYAVVNVLSQFRYVNMETGEIDLPRQAARELLECFLERGSMNQRNIKAVLVRHRIECVFPPDSTTLSKSQKYLKVIKPALEKAGYTWKEYIDEEQFDLFNPSRLHRIGEVLSKFQTPKRKRKELEKLGFLNKDFIRNSLSIRFSGTANVSYKFMIETIEAFLNGETYGNFQARKNKEYEDRAALVPLKNEGNTVLPEIDDKDMIKNPVVFRSINETRKVANELLRKYGLPSGVNVETAGELNSSFLRRDEMRKKQNKREKEKDRLLEDLCRLLGYDKEEISGHRREKMREKYELYLLQDCKCLYSGKDLRIDNLDEYEIDHIVPYSLVLDNTMNNKALVLLSENRHKRQRVPLEYLLEPEKTDFVNRVKLLYKQKKISDRKYKYLMLETINSEESQLILDEWKSRNINDTRYITKYITGYFRRNLGLPKEKVYGIKGAITARFRRIWLNTKTWGADKDREGSYLHHAVDAIVIACLSRPYVEIASDNMKLREIYQRSNPKNRHVILTDEYKDYLGKCIRKMKKYYHWYDEAKTREYLCSLGKVPCVILNLRDEVDIRMNDYDPELFADRVRDFYRDDLAFADSLRPVLVSHKPERKCKGELSASNPIRVQLIDGAYYKVLRIPISDLKKKDVSKVRTGDGDLLQTLETIFEGKESDYSVGNYLKDNHLATFCTLKGRIMHKVSKIDKQIQLDREAYVKEISDGNYAVLDARCYYCVEIYEDDTGKIQTRGIRLIDILRKDKKLWLNCDYPAGYKKHIMYLQKNDYIEVIGPDGNLKIGGWYKSVKNIKRSQFYIVPGNAANRENITIATRDTVTKYHVDLLGKRGGKVRCGEPLLSTTVKK